ncbi:MAG TPA: Minf_1886 family protein [Phycisphaerae bacterium]|nr:Minf_1886 family protein [Phycisphaerae bacterium]
MSVSQTTQNPIEAIADRLGKYRPEAYEFLRQGLDVTVQKTHGQIAKSVRKVIEWLESEGAQLSELPALLRRKNVPRFVAKFIEESGSIKAATQRLNLHVDGEDLCWGLRDLALDQWGLLAPVVLRHWGIRSTKDFGRMVFALVDHGLLQKQPEDDIRDFDNVFDFETAFVQSYKIDLSRQPAKAEKSE